MKPGDFLRELQRRKVIGPALIYALVGWAVIEAADTILPNLDVPEWAVSLVIVLVILGFPVALVLSWMFDVGNGSVTRTGGEAGATQEGRDRAPEGAAGPSTPGAPVDDPRGGGTSPATVPAPPHRGPPVPSEKSIAVLPFVNMSDDRENEYFSDGMTEEILNALAKVRQLQVASRTSCFAFKGHETDVLEIAEKLRVATVVEGSVRKAGNRIRVTAQLISAEDGYHLWSETYDRELQDVFRVQDEIARSVVDALRIELMGEEEKPLVEQETRNMEAYNLYLKGRFFHTRDNEEDLRRSLALYRAALSHDPGFARAHAGMADTWMQLADDWMPPEKAYPEAKAAAERAVVRRRPLGPGEHSPAQRTAPRSRGGDADRPGPRSPVSRLQLLAGPLPLLQPRLRGRPRRGGSGHRAGSQGLPPPDRPGPMPSPAGPRQRGPGHPPGRPRGERRDLGPRLHRPGADRRW